MKSKLWNENSLRNLQAHDRPHSWNSSVFSLNMSNAAILPIKGFIVSVKAIYRRQPDITLTSYWWQWPPKSEQYQKLLNMYVLTACEGRPIIEYLNLFRAFSESTNYLAFVICYSNQLVIIVLMYHNPSFLGTNSPHKRHTNVVNYFPNL
jgi:hypothetical protein